MEMRKYSPRTVKSYTAVLSGLSKYFGVSPEKITTEQLKDYFHYHTTVLNRSTSFVSQTLGALKILRVDVLGLDWESTINIKRPRRIAEVPEVLSKEEVLAILEAIKNLKHKAIIALLYSTGLRIEELIYLKLKDIDSDRMMVRVERGKGNKTRHTLLSKTAISYLRAYYRASTVKPHLYVFENPTSAGKRYSCSSVRKIVKRAVAKAGIKKNVSPHTFRHSFATHLLEQGVNLKLIQRLMGHSSLKSTLVYLHVAKFDLEKIESPLDVPC
jgi:site-specific recombinase XerD